MAKWKIKNVSLTGVSLCVPEKTIRTEDIPFFSAEEAESFINTIGIRERRIADEMITASDMCQKAAEALLFKLGWEKDSIDVLIFESVTGDYKTPPTSTILQDKLGLPDTTFCLDLPMGCCGCIYAITVGANLLSSGNVKRALLLIGDTALRMGSMKDKSRVPLFGDAGTCMALEYNQEAPEIVVDFHTYGKGYEALMTPHGGYRNPVTPNSFIEEDFGNGIIRAPKDALINGMDVFSFAISKPPKSIEVFLEEENIDRNKDIDYFLIHQANKMIVDRVVKKLKISIERTPYNLEEYGNLGGASLPSLMVTRLKDQLSTEPQRLLMSSFGLGLTWATMRATFGPLVIPEIQYI